MQFAISSSDKSTIEIQACPKKMIQWYTQQFNVRWLKDPDLNDWLQQNSYNKNLSYCKCCKITLKNVNKSMLI